MSQGVSLRARLRRVLSRERALAMVWRVEKDGRISHLAGAAHFFPYRFRDALRRRIGAARALVLEGPLDEAAMRKVVEAGSARNGPSLYDRLDPLTLRRLRKMLGSPPLSVSQLYLDVLQGGAQEWLRAELSGLRPWMAFFRLWGQLRRRDGWTFNMERDGLAIATAHRTPVHCLETIEEQIATLNRIPVEGIVAFLKDVDWDDYRTRYERHYLAGDLPALMAIARAFPTYCEAVIERRNPLLHQRLLPHLERGDAFALIGVTHCEGIIDLLHVQGWSATQAREPALG